MIEDAILKPAFTLFSANQISSWCISCQKANWAENADTHNLKLPIGNKRKNRQSNENVLML